tara:strand:- start:1809 stop:2159 length:351 start_codon:yes stop_codon:yes gene_type:complete
MRAFILFVSSIWKVVFSCSNSNIARPGRQHGVSLSRSSNPFDPLPSPGERGGSPVQVRVSCSESYLDSPTYLRWTRELSAEEILGVVPPEKRGSLPSWRDSLVQHMERNGFTLTER